MPRFLLLAILSLVFACGSPRAARAGDEGPKDLKVRAKSLQEAIRAEEDGLAAYERLGKSSEAAAARERLAGLYDELAAVSTSLASSLRGGAAPRAPAAPAAATRPAGPAGPPPSYAPQADAYAALDWLARHQSSSGHWDADGFSSACQGGKCGGAGGPLYDPGITGLAVLAFLGCGETHKTARYGHVVKDGLKYLKAIQDAEGCFGPRTSGHFTYNHALGTIAMCEAYGLTQSPLFRSSAQSAVDFVHRAQNPYLGWRYGVRPGDNDTAVTGWMVMALASAKQAGLRVEPEAFRGALSWIDKVTEPESGRVGYTQRGNGPSRPTEGIDRFPPDRSESLTAEGIFARMLCRRALGEEPARDRLFEKGIDLCLKTPPAWDEAAGRVDFHYWYFGTLATSQAGENAWRTWSASLRGAVATHQRGDVDGCLRGSFDPVDPWGPEGGRVYSTAMGAMLLKR